MEEKGFLVTTDGCMFPHEQYGVRGAGATLKGHQRSCYFFTGMMPWKLTTGKAGKPAKGKAQRDKDGWPTSSHVSHLCHRGSCVRPNHLQIEPQVVNIRRNFCGILKTGSCDCGMQPPCLRKYHPTEWEDPDLKYCQTVDELNHALEGLGVQFPFTVLDREAVRRDAMKSNAKKRKLFSGPNSPAKKRG